MLERFDLSCSLTAWAVLRHASTRELSWTIDRRCIRKRERFKRHGADRQSFGWRSAFYFLSAFAGTVEVLFLIFPETWRKEVSDG